MPGDDIPTWIDKFKQEGILHVENKAYPWKNNESKVMWMHVACNTLFFKSVKEMKGVYKTALKNKTTFCRVCTGDFITHVEQFWKDILDLPLDDAKSRNDIDVFMNVPSNKMTAEKYKARLDAAKNESKVKKVRKMKREKHVDDVDEVDDAMNVLTIDAAEKVDEETKSIKKAKKLEKSKLFMTNVCNNRGIRFALTNKVEYTSRSIEYDFECMRPKCIAKNPTNRIFKGMIRNINRLPDATNGHCNEAGTLYVKRDRDYKKNSVKNVNDIKHKVNEICTMRVGFCLTEINDRVSTSIKLRWKCAICDGHEWLATLNNVHYKGSWCPNCNQLKKHTQTSVRMCVETLFHKQFPANKNLIMGKNGRYVELDLFNDDLKLGGEYHDREHFDANSFFNRDEPGKFETKKMNDELKIKECAAMGIGLFIVPYTETRKGSRYLKEFIIRQPAVIDTMNKHGIVATDEWLNELIAMPNVSTNYMPSLLFYLDQRKDVQLKVVNPNAIIPTNKIDFEMECTKHNPHRKFITTMDKLKFYSTSENLLTKKLVIQCDLCYPAGKNVNIVNKIKEVFIKLDLVLADPDAEIVAEKSMFEIICKGGYAHYNHPGKKCHYITHRGKLQIAIKESVRKPRRCCPACKSSKSPPEYRMSEMSNDEKEQSQAKYESMKEIIDKSNPGRKKSKKDTIDD